MSNLPKTSVIDIAMGILENMDPRGNSLPDVTPSPKGNKIKEEVETFVPDVSDAEVSQQFIENLIEGTMNIPIKKTSKKVVVKEQNKQPSKKINEDKVNDLIQRLSSLLAEAKEMITEMTTVGMIGANTLGGKTKKN